MHILYVMRSRGEELEVARVGQVLSRRWMEHVRWRFHEYFTSVFLTRIGVGTGAVQ